MGVVMAWRVWLIHCSFYSFWEPGIVPLLLDDHVAKNLLYFEVMDHIDNGELDTRWLWCRCVQWIEHARSWYDVSPCGIMVVVSPAGEWEVGREVKEALAELKRRGQKREVCDP